MSAETKCRNWAFTSYTAEDEPPLWAPNWMRYLVYQREECPNTHRHHWQGTVVYKNACQFATAKARINGEPHIERCIDLKSSREYCTKTGKFADKEGVLIPGVEFGEFPCQGKRNDLLKTKDALDKGESPDKLLEEDDHFVAFSRNQPFFHAYAAHQKRRRTFQAPNVTVYYGESGTGKTRKVWDLITDVDDVWVWTPQAEKWFDGYYGQDTVLFDEYRGQLPFAQLLTLLDGYPGVRAQIKGSSVMWSPKTIYITSPKHPCEWYTQLSHTDSYTQLERRITKIELMSR